MLFISVEGIDGSGKSTQVKCLVESLKAVGKTVVQTKEPDGGHLGGEVRAMLTRDRDRPLSKVEEMLLVSAARYDHVHSLIRPALAEGKWVVCDRFLDSTFALQVYSGSIPVAAFEAIADLVTERIRPDLTFILDLPDEVALARRSNRTILHEPDPAEERRNFSVIRQGFLVAAKAAPDRCHVIDATRASDAIARDIFGIVSHHSQ